MTTEERTRARVRLVKQQLSDLENFQQLQREEELRLRVAYLRENPPPDPLTVSTDYVRPTKTEYQFARMCRQNGFGIQKAARKYFGIPASFDGVKLLYADLLARPGVQAAMLGVRPVDYVPRERDFCLR